MVDTLSSTPRQACHLITIQTAVLSPQVCLLVRGMSLHIPRWPSSCNPTEGEVASWTICYGGSSSLMGEGGLLSINSLVVFRAAAL